MSAALIARARLLCAHATFVRPSGPFTEYDAPMRHPTIQAKRRTLLALGY
jgi:hypothetical protein